MLPSAIKSIPIISGDCINSVQDFEDIVSSRRFPAIIRGSIDIGPCVKKWNPQYLTSTVHSDKKVKVHKSRQPQLDFRAKNFVYDTISFCDLVDYCSSGSSSSPSGLLHPISHEEVIGVQQTPAEDNPPDKYFWYLRSLGTDPRGKDVSDLSVHFPELYKDLKIPDFFPPEAFFSSVFRITSPSLQLWTHYDTCDNILIQIRGRKRIVFFPPTSALDLYLDGDKSEVLDIDKTDLNKFPKFINAQRYEIQLEEGDIVFIPALWFHNVTALDFSISVNVFWKNLNSELYDKKDTYGNRDLIPVQLAFKTFEKATKQLNCIPAEYEDFYLRRMIISIEKRLKTLQTQRDTTDLEEETN